MKLRRSRRRKRIVIATSIAVFSLANSFAATYAWFTMNSSVAANGMTVRINNEGSSLAMLTIHRCNLSASTDNNLVFYSEPDVVVSSSGISTASVNMDNYSDLNRTQPILLLFGLNEGVNESDVTISAKSENEDYVATITRENISSFPFSTSVCFKSASYTDESFPFDNVETSSLVNNTSFVDINNHTLSGYSSQIALFSGNQDRTIKYVAVIMDYYPEAREILLTNNVGVDILALENNNVINFYCDWILEI